MRWALVLVAVLAVVAGCTGAAPVSEWRELSAPAKGARVLEFVPWKDGVLALGSVPSGDGRAPAAWTSTDGSTWQTVPAEPHSPYAVSSELISAGVGQHAVALGRAFGGSHGNPRMTVWSGDTAKLVEYPQIFEMFGGPHAIAVTAAAALGGTEVLIGDWDGPDGRYGAAIWTSTDGANWQRRADDPALSSAPGEQTGAAAITTGPAGFTIVGQSQQSSGLQPLEWTSPDAATWQRIPLPGKGAATRVACDTNRCTVFGQSVGGTSQVLCWPNAAATPVPGPTATTIDTLKLVVGDTRTFAAVRLDGKLHVLSVDANCADWQEISSPAQTLQAQLIALPAGLLLATTDDDHSRLWLHALPA